MPKRHSITITPSGKFTAADEGADQIARPMWTTELLDGWLCQTGVVMGGAG